ncbi:hypothetical protein M9Y10_019684 [Tritrichomonas musculus]|uniref:Uncharacterized protein n=1 Tax=Tritrichomonas musculus TaxID=1915356 RepID=A0ABR2HGY8_9EUKA
MQNSILNYINKKKEIQEKLLSFIDNEEEETNEQKYQDLLQYFDESKYNNYIGDNKEILIMLNKIALNHRRTSNFFERIEKILLDIQEPIKNRFLPYDIYCCFKNNKRILLFLIQNNFIKVDQNLVDQILYNRENYKAHYHAGTIEYLFPEIKEFLPKKMYKKISGSIYHIEKINVQEDSNLPLFEELRSKGENPSMICELIRKDSIDEFIEYVTRNGLLLNSSIKRSIFETNPLLNQKEYTSLIEYASFFGSVKIFNFLRMNKIEVQPSLMKFAIHSNNADMIHLIEEFMTKEDLPENFYQLGFEETLKCHNFDLSEYFLNNFISNPVLHKSVKWMNFEYFPAEFSHDIFYHLCKNDCYNYISVFFEKDRGVLPHNQGILDEAFGAAVRMNNTNIMNLFYDYLNSYSYKRLIRKYKFSSTFTIDYNFKELDIIQVRNASFSKKLIFSRGVSYIIPYFFHKFPYIEEITFQKPSQIESFDNGVFYGRTSLKEIEIPASVKVIHKRAFCKCTGLKKVTFEEESSVYQIDKYAFFECSSLEQIVIPPSVKKIGKNIFEKCNSLVRVLIPSSLQSEVTKEYLNCPAQTTVEYY